MPTPERTLPARGGHKGQRGRWSLGDRLFTGVVGFFIALFVFLVYHSMPSFSRYGLSFLTTSTFDPVHEVFGVLPMISGSLATAAIALLIGVPVSLGVAVFSSELSPSRIKTALSFVVE